jgi:hypothetical protein
MKPDRSWRYLLCPVPPVPRQHLAHNLAAISNTCNLHPLSPVPPARPLPFPPPSLPPTAAPLLDLLHSPPPPLLTFPLLIAKARQIANQHFKEKKFHSRSCETRLPPQCYETRVGRTVRPRKARQYYQLSQSDGAAGGSELSRTQPPRRSDTRSRGCGGDSEASTCAHATARIDRPSICNAG